MAEWKTCTREGGGIIYIDDGIEGRVYYRKGWWAAEVMHDPNIYGPKAEIFKNEDDAKKWCEHLILVEQIVWRT